MTFGFHLCRGNQASRWLVEGGYEPIAGRVFRRVAAHRLLLEYDDERSGSFQPLQEVPDDKVVVLGLVTTKSPRRETVAELTGRVREAARHIDLRAARDQPPVRVCDVGARQCARPGRPAHEARDARRGRPGALGLSTRPGARVAVAALNPSQYGRWTDRCPAPCPPHW